MGVFFLIILAGVGGGLFALIQWAGIQRSDALWYDGNIAFTAFLVLLAFRLVSLPLIQNFGDMGSDTHGSARFATPKEARPLTKDETMINTNAPEWPNPGDEAHAIEQARRIRDQVVKGGLRFEAYLPPSLAL